MVIADLSNKRASGGDFKVLEDEAIWVSDLGVFQLKEMVNQNSEAGLSMVIIVPSDLQ